MVSMHLEAEAEVLDRGDAPVGLPRERLRELLPVAREELLHPHRVARCHPTHAVSKTFDCLKFDFKTVKT